MTRNLTTEVVRHIPRVHRMISGLCRAQLPSLEDLDDLPAEAMIAGSRHFGSMAAFVIAMGEVG